MVYKLHYFWKDLYIRTTFFRIYYDQTLKCSKGKDGTFSYTGLPLYPCNSTSATCPELLDPNTDATNITWNYQGSAVSSGFK
jgi:hypothetical protein